MDDRARSLDGRRSCPVLVDEGGAGVRLARISRNLAAQSKTPLRNRPKWTSTSVDYGDLIVTHVAKLPQGDGAGYNQLGGILSIRTFFLGGAFAFALSGLAPASAAVTALGVDFTSPGYTGSNSAWTVGYQFVANSNVSISGLATWDSWGAAGSVEVGLWDSSQNLLASASVSNSLPTIGSADWSYANIAPVALTAGDTYYVGSYGSDANFAGYTDGFTVDSRITYVKDAYSYGAFAFPNISFGLTTGGGFFGGNVILGAPEPSMTLGAPEPSTWALLLLGFAGLGFAGYGASRKVA
jgi:Domain of unknown function (DUF4082)